MRRKVRFFQWVIVGVFAWGASVWAAPQAFRQPGNTLFQDANQVGIAPLFNNDGIFHILNVDGKPIMFENEQVSVGAQQNKLFLQYSTQLKRGFMGTQEENGLHKLITFVGGQQNFVGIGPVNNPKATLHVGGNVLIDNEVNMAGNLRVGGSICHTQGPCDFGLKIDRNGNVGIGTQVMDADLTVFGNASQRLSGEVSILFREDEVVGRGTLFLQELRPGDSLFVEDHIVQVLSVEDNSHATLTEIFEPDNRDSIVEKPAYIDSDLVKVRNAIGQTKFLINREGKVGIGTTDPNSGLHIRGSGAGARLNIEAAGVDENGEGFDSQLYLTAARDGGLRYNTARIYADAQQGGNTPNTSFDIIDADANGWDQGIILKNTGGADTFAKVGIGTDDPRTRLDVHGGVFVRDNEGNLSMSIRSDNGYVGLGGDPRGARLDINGGRFSLGDDGGRSCMMHVQHHYDTRETHFGVNGCGGNEAWIFDTAGGPDNDNNEMLRIQANGARGNNSTLMVAGRVSVGGDVVHASDIRLKKDVQVLQGSLEKLMSIEGVSYQWKDESKGTGTQIGVIAQDVEEVFPELVRTNNDGYKSVNYSGLVAPLIEAVKAQQTQIEEQQALVAHQQQTIEALKLIVCGDHPEAAICKS